MEYVQDRITTLHDLPGSDAPAVNDRLEETAVVVPMTGEEYERPSATRILSTLESLEPAAVVVPVRTPPDAIGRFDAWLSTFDLPMTTLWCNAPSVTRLLADAEIEGYHGKDHHVEGNDRKDHHVKGNDGKDHHVEGHLGKGHDVWLALGVATTEASTVVVHDADVVNYDERYVRRLLAGIDLGQSFVKGYYARVEHGQLYGRLFRLFITPLLRALEGNHPIVSYLASFRYALAGEFAMTDDLARRICAPRSWGLEIGILGDAFAHAGFDGTAQVDLGRHEHDHRPVTGTTGLETMSRQVGATLFHVLSDYGVTPDFERLTANYLDVGRRLVEQYRSDARFNGYEYDEFAETEQLERYAGAIAPPPADDRLPSWTEIDLDPTDLLVAGRSERVSGRRVARD